MSTEQLINELRDKIQRLEAFQRTQDAVVSTGLSALDELFPQKGIAAGTLVEWLSQSAGNGATTLALLLAGRLQKSGGAVVVIDDAQEYYPPAAAALGVNLSQTLLIQTRQRQDTLWAWEQALRSSAVAVVVGWLDPPNDRIYRRLQLAAETGGSVGFLLRGDLCRTEPTWAETRFLVETLPCGPPSSASRRLGLQLLYSRNGRSGRCLELELKDEAGVVHLVSTLAHPEAAPRAPPA